MKRALAALACACVGACAATGHAALRESAQAGLFRVHARDRVTAERVLAECQALAPGVLAGPAGGEAHALDVYCTPVRSTYGEGRNLSEFDPELRRFHGIEVDIGKELAWERYVIAHELAHSWLAPEWHPLPQILEEGLADLAGEGADPEVGVCRRLLHGLRLLTWAGIGYPCVRDVGGRKESGVLRLGHPEPGLPELGRMLELDGSGFHEVTGAENRTLLYAVGYALVEQIGLSKLKELCLRARAEGLRQVPSEWLLEAGGLQGDGGRSWAIRGQRLIGEPEEQMLERCIAGVGPFRFHFE